MVEGKGFGVMAYKDPEKAKAYRREYYLANKDNEETKAKRRAYNKLYREKNLEKIKEKERVYHQENKEKRNANSQKWNKANKGKNLEKKRAYNKAYQEANKEKIREKKKEYREANSEKIKEYGKKWRENNQDKIWAYREDNKEAIKENKKQWYEKNKKLTLKQKKIYREENKEEIRRKQSVYNKKFYQKNKEEIKNRNRLFRKTDMGKAIEKRRSLKIKSIPEKQMMSRLRTRVRDFLKPASVKKQTFTQELVGCDPFFLKEYLEKKFKKGMSWDNRKLWDIDHIIPLNFFHINFDIKDVDVQKVAFHYSNLQPLFREDNSSKGDNIYINSSNPKIGRIVVDMKSKDAEIFIFLIIEQIHKKLDLLKKNKSIRDVGKITSVVWNKFYKLADE